jgi:acetyltransferase
MALSLKFNQLNSPLMLNFHHTNRISFFLVSGALMGPHYLNRFFTPKSVAIVGASEREASVGYRLLLNMQEAGFKGGLYPVNNKRDTLLGLKAYPDLNAVPEDLDLVVIATPAASVQKPSDCNRKSWTSPIATIFVLSARTA